MVLQLTGQQIGILDYKVVRHCQQLTDERTTAREYEDRIVEYAKRRVNGLLRRQRAAHDNLNCLRIVRRGELSEQPSIFEDEASDPMLYSTKPVALNQIRWA